LREIGKTLQALLTKCFRILKKLRPSALTLLLAGFVAVFTLILCAVAWLEVKQLAKSRVRSAVVKAEKKLGMPIKVKTWNVGIGNVTFEDVVVGKDAHTVISQVNVEVGITPFANDFGKINALTIEKIRIKHQLGDSSATKETVAWDLESVISKETSAKIAGAVNKFFEVMPSKKLVIRSAGIQVYSEKRQLLDLEGVALLVERASRRVTFKVKAAKVGADVTGLEVLEETDLFGKLRLRPAVRPFGKKRGLGDEPPTYAFFLKKKTTDSAHNDWAVSGKIAAATLDFAQIKFQMRQVPDFVKASSWGQNLSSFVAFKSHDENTKNTENLAGEIELRREKAVLETSASPREKLPTPKSENQPKNQESLPWQVAVKLRSTGLIVKMPLLSKNFIGPVNANFNADGIYKPSENIFSVTDAQLNLPAKTPSDTAVSVNLAMSGKWALEDAKSQAPRLAVQGHVNMPATPCQSLLNAAPKGLLPALKGFLLEGDAKIDFDLNFDSRRLESMTLTSSDTFFGCRVTKSPENYTAEHLQGAFTLERNLGEGLMPVMLTVGASDLIAKNAANRSDLDAKAKVKQASAFTATMPQPLTALAKMASDLGADIGNAATNKNSVTDETANSFTPLDHIARQVDLAFTTSEDVGFWSHKGIDLASLEGAFRRNLAAGKIVIGGSTITMQTVKNLFLSQDRTVSRKLQELFLAWHLESTLQKERILELYMNIVEFGPGIYGITHAASHFFDKKPADLNLLEAAYLAEVLPSPKVRYRYFCTGQLTPNFKDMVGGLLRRMLALQRINSEQYSQAMEEMGDSLRFNEQSRLSSQACAKQPGETTKEPDPS
jgi:hypothetical protein